MAGLPASGWGRLQTDWGTPGNGSILLPPRLNNAPVSGYEGDVGSKTTMRLFYPESAHFNPKVENNPDTLLVLVAFKAMDFHWIESILSDKKRVCGDTGTLPESGPPCRDVCSAVPELAWGDVNPVSCRAARQPGPGAGRSQVAAKGAPGSRLPGAEKLPNSLPGREPGAEERATVVSQAGAG